MLKLHFQNDQKNGALYLHGKLDMPTPPTKMNPTTPTMKMNNSNQDNAENEEPLPPRRPPPRNQPQPPPPSSQPTKRIYDPKLWLNNPEMCEMIGRSC